MSANVSEDFLAMANVDTQLDVLKNVLRNHAHSHPRHHQKALGPSEVGHPCARHVMQGMLGIEAINPQFDPLPSYLGVAGHGALEEGFQLDNRRLVAEGLHPRWLTETRVTVSPGLAGSCDLFDLWESTVVDFKFPGTSRMTHYRKEGPSEVYRTQVHLYAKGFANMGFPVKKVAIWFLPRGGQLATSMLWSEAYDSGRVDVTLKRLESLTILADELDVDAHPERLALIPTTPSECQFCDWFTVREHHPNPAACRGQGFVPQHTDRKAAS